jgi:hypothetical protein
LGSAKFPFGDGQVNVPEGLVVVGVAIGVLVDEVTAPVVVVITPNF